MIGKNAFVQIASSLISGLITFFSLSLSARLFGPETLGNLAYLFGLTGLILAFSDMGFSRAHVYYSSAKEKLGEHLGTFLGLKLFLLLISSLLVIGYVFRVQPIAAWPLFALVLATEIFTRFSDSILITFEALQRSWPQNLVRLAAKLAKLAAIIILAQTLRNSLGYGLAFAVEAGLLLFLSLWLLFKFLPLKFNRDLANKYVLYSLPFFAIVPLSYLQDNSSIVILKHFTSAAEVGFYSSALNLSGFVKTLYGAIMLYFFPKIASLHIQNDQRLIQSYLDTASRYLLLGFIPIFMTLFWLRQELIVLILGSQFLPAAPLFGLLLLGVFILMLLAPYDQVLFATKNHRPLVLVNIGTLILIIIASWLLVPRLGASGTIIASIIAWLFNGFWHLWLIRSRLQLKFFPYTWQFIIPAVIILSLASVSFNYLPQNLVVKLAVTAVSLSGYLILLLVTGLISRMDFKYLKTLI